MFGHHLHASATPCLVPPVPRHYEGVRLTEEAATALEEAQRRRASQTKRRHEAADRELADLAAHVEEIMAQFATDRFPALVGTPKTEENTLESEFMGQKFEVKIVKDLVPSGDVYMFADPKFLGSQHSYPDGLARAVRVRCRNVAELAKLTPEALARCGLLRCRIDLCDEAGNVVIPNVEMMMDLAAAVAALRGKDGVS